jgi:hypothetical protein
LRKLIALNGSVVAGVFFLWNFGDRRTRNLVSKVVFALSSSRLREIGGVGVVDFGTLGGLCIDSIAVLRIGSAAFSTTRVGCFNTLASRRS